MEKNKILDIFSWILLSFALILTIFVIIFLTFTGKNYIPWYIWILSLIITLFCLISLTMTSINKYYNSNKEIVEYSIENNI